MNPWGEKEAALIQKATNSYVNLASLPEAYYPSSDLSFHPVNRNRQAASLRHMITPDL